MIYLQKYFHNFYYFIPQSSKIAELGQGNTIPELGILAFCEEVIMATKADCADPAMWACARLKNLRSVVFEGASIVSWSPLCAVRQVAMALQWRAQLTAPPHRLSPQWRTRAGTILPVGAPRVGGGTHHFMKLIAQRWTASCRSQGSSPVHSTGRE